MEEKFKYIAAYIRGGRDNRINSIMNPNPYQCDAELNTSQIKFKAQDWQKNQWGEIHGGLIATMFDIAIGMSIMAFYDYKQVSTTELDISYVRPFSGNSFLFEVDVVNPGRFLCRARALAYDEDTGKCLASASASYVHKSETIVSP